MAQVIDATKNLVKLDNGQTITAQVGGWYDAQQYWGGTLSAPGVINSQSNQPGAGQAVNPAVVAQSNPDQGLKPGTNEAYIKAQQAKYGQVQAPVAGQPAGGAVPAGGGMGTGAGAGGSFAMPTQSVINLPEIYSNLYTQSGILEKENQLRDLETKYLEQKGKISDNPFLSASMVDQRLQRLQRKYEEQTTPLRNEVATKKADIETQLNLQTKQFDINSQSARDALNYFNTLLEAGALDTASGDAIAQITMATGIPSSLIYSAIGARKEKDVKTELITSTADSGVVTATVINSLTGDVIKQTSLGKVGNAQTGDKVSDTEAKRLIRDDIISEAQAGATWDDIIKLARIGGLDERDAYGIYTSFGIYSPDVATQKKDLERYGINTTGYATY